MGRNYDLDSALYYLPLTIFMFGIAYLQIFFILYYYQIRPDPSLSTSKLARFLTKSTHQLVRMVLGKVFKPGTNDSEEDPKTFFYDYQVTNFVVYAFAIIIYEMFLVLAMIFWDKLLFKVSYGCPYNFDVPNLNCYNSTSRNLINCSDVDSMNDPMNDPNIECYQLIFDWSSAAGTTGGLYILLSIVITCIPQKMVKVLAGDSKKSIICMCLLLLIFIIIAFIGYSIFLFKSKFIYGVFFSALGMLNVVLTVLLIPFKKANFKKLDGPNAETHVNRNATVNGANK